MRETVQQEIKVCDFCESKENVFNTCSICGKDICYKCHKTGGVTFHQSCFYSGSGDGCYCDMCLAENANDELILAYRKIVTLGTERDAYYKDFEVRHTVAEKAIKAIRGRKGL